MPPRRVLRGKGSAKDARDSRSKNIVEEPAKLVLNPGAGWTNENYHYIKTVPREKLENELYKMFGVPLMYKTDPEHAAIKIFIEYHITSFLFASQFADASKALMVLTLLTDYLGNVPAFSSSKSSFGLWVERASKVIQNTDFTQQETQVIMSYISNNLRANSHVLHFVITNEFIQKMDQEGLKLFKPIIAVKKENAEENNNQGPSPDDELEAQLAAAALAERGAAEEAQRQLELAQSIEGMVAESLNTIKTALDQRNDVLIQQLFAIEDRIDGTSKRRKPPSSD